MILLADSGSTKTDWRLIDKGQEIKQVTTLGFNPMLQNASSITEEINSKLIPEIGQLMKESKSGTELSIFFYGAGCSTETKCEIIHSALKSTFPYSVTEVDHDLLAAARSVCGKEKGIVAILGTGSNSCFYDGSKITANVASLGFILGDEGSGANIGKQFLTDYLNQELPASIAHSFKEKYGLGKEEILEAVYKQAMPSRFLASFSKFIYLNKKEEYIQNLIATCFRNFFQHHICKYPEHKQYKMHCIGSIGFFYKDILRSVAEEKGVTLGTVIESPMAGLIRFHTGSVLTS
ncbi:MAG: N-acetylglucosamine kinase [Bacteroidota bacterium]|nr:N-acetylglucosamine kinase [Bacteroidota bacterium]